MFMIPITLALPLLIFLNLSYVWVAVTDFVRLNWMLSLNACLIIPLQMRMYYKTFRVFPCFFEKMVKTIIPSKFVMNINHSLISNWNDFTKTTIIDINDNDSLYNWLSVRHYFLEFGKGFRKRELSIVATGLLSWLLIFGIMLIETFFFGENVVLTNYLIVAMCMILYMIPTCITVLVASKIQTNFDKEINLLNQRKFEDLLQFTHTYTENSIIMNMNDSLNHVKNSIARFNLSNCNDEKQNQRNQEIDININMNEAEMGKGGVKNLQSISIVADVEVENSHDSHNIDTMIESSRNRETKIDNAIDICCKMNEFYCRKIGFETIIQILSQDSKFYSFTMLGIRVDQGILTLIIPLVISVVTTIVRGMFV